MEYWDDDDDGSWWVAPDPEPEVDADEEEQAEEEQPNPKELKSILKSKSQLVKTVGALKIKNKAQMSEANANKAKNTLDCWNSTAIKNEAQRKEREKITEGQKPLAFNNVFKTGVGSGSSGTAVFPLLQQMVSFSVGNMIALQC